MEEDGATLLLVSGLEAIPTAVKVRWHLARWTWVAICECMECVRGLLSQVATEGLQCLGTAHVFGGNIRGTR